MARIFKNWEDLRTDHEIDLTNHLIEAVSDLNLLLHNTKEYPCTHANKDIVTITINGVPSNKEEFQGFTFTKKVVNYFPPALEPDRSPEFYEKRIWDASLETVLREMDEIVQQNGDQVVFASHSYGSYMVTAYAKKFPQKIKGIIEFGAVPVTAYMALKQFGKDYIFGNGNLDRAHLIKNADKIFQEYLDWVKAIGVQSLGVIHKYGLISFFLTLPAEVFTQMFEWRRQTPKILKLITFGRKDELFEVFLLNEMACYFAYGAGSLDSAYNAKMCKAYTSLTGYETQNVQERFIYSYPKAGHGLHYKRKKPLQNLINLYLALVLDGISQSASL